MNGTVQAKLVCTTDDFHPNYFENWCAVQLYDDQSNPDTEQVGYSVIVGGTDDFAMVKRFPVDQVLDAQNFYAAVQDGVTIAYLDGLGFEVLLLEVGD